MVGGTKVKGGTKVEYDSVIVHFTDGRAPRVVDCVTDFTKSRHLRTGEDSLQILHKSCEGEVGNRGALVVKPFEVPLSEIDHLVLRDEGQETRVDPQELLS